MASPINTAQYQHKTYMSKCLVRQSLRSSNFEKHALIIIIKDIRKVVHYIIYYTVHTHYHAFRVANREDAFNRVCMHLTSIVNVHSCVACSTWLNVQNVCKHM